MNDQQQLIECFRHFGSETDALGNPVSLHTVLNFQKTMDPEDFHRGLTQAAQEAFEQEKIDIVSYIVEIDAKVSNEDEVQESAKKYFEEAEARGMEPDEQLKKLFFQ